MNDSDHCGPAKSLKDLENKNVTVGEFKSKEKAIQVYQDCIKKYQLNNID